MARTGKKRCQWVDEEHDRYVGLPRRGVGCRRSRRSHAVRIPPAGGRASGTELGDDSEKARKLPTGLRRIRPAENRRLRETADTETAEKRGDCSQPAQSGKRRWQRPSLSRHPGRVRLLRPLRVGIRRWITDPERVEETRRRAREDNRVGDDEPGSQRKEVSGLWGRRSATPSCRPPAW